MVGVAVTAPAVLDVHDLRVSYAGAVKALRGVSLSVPEGAVVAVLGNNGAGKSTLLRALSGTLPAQGGAITGGTIQFRGQALPRDDAASIARGGLVQVPEGRRVFGNLTVEENLRAGALAAPDKAARAEARAWVDELFPILRERASQRAGLLSGGEQQMLAIGRALMASPKVLLLDEPSLGLAPKIVERVGAVIREINERGVTVVLVEQNAAMALSVADRAVVLEVGEVALEGHGRRAGRERGGQGALPRRRAGHRRHAAARRELRAAARGRRPVRALRRPRRAQRRLLHGRARLAARADRPQRRGQVHVPERALAASTRPAPARSATASGELTRLRPHRIAALGVARTFQNIALSPRVSVLDNLLVARHRLMRSGFIADGLRLPRARRERAGHEARVREIAALLGLDELERPVGTLPYGTRKRVELARALCAEPELLLLDEPVAGMVHDESAAMARGDHAGPRRARHLRPAGRARHDVRDGHGRPRDGARLRQADRGRHAGRGPARPGGAHGLPRRCGVNQFVTLFVGGLFLGAIYSLVALGFVTVFKATHVINFAQGSVLLLGAYVIARAHESVGFALAVALGVLVAAAASILIDAVLIRRIRRADLGTLAILTLGVDILLATELSRRIGTDVLSIGAPWGNARDGAGRHPRRHLARDRGRRGRACSSPASGLAFKFTDFGIAMRSAAEDGEAASLMGIRLNRVAATAWALAGALAAVGGLFLTSFPAAGVTGGVGRARAGDDPRRGARRVRLARRRRGRRADHRRRLRAHRGLPGGAVVPRARAGRASRRSR